MRLGVIASIAGAGLLALGIALGLSGFIFPVTHEMISTATDTVESYQRIRVGLGDDWLRHGSFATWGRRSDGTKRIIESGSYRRGVKVGTWQLWDADGRLRRYEEFDRSGKKLLYRSYQAGVLHAEETFSHDGDRQRSEVKLFASDGTTLSLCGYLDGELSAIDGIEVRKERSEAGRLDRAVHRGVTPDGKALTITYHFDRRDNVREIVRVIDGVEAERIRTPALIGADRDDTYDYDKHTWVD